MLYFASNVTAVYALSHVRSYIFTAIMNSRIVFAAVLSLVVLDKTIRQGSSTTRPGGGVRPVAWRLADRPVAERACWVVLGVWCGGGGACSTEQWRAILIIFCSATVLCLEDVQVGTRTRQTHHWAFAVLACKRRKSSEAGWRVGGEG